MPKTYTAAGSATAGDVYTASAHNVIVTNVNNFIVPPIVRVRRSAALNFANGVTTALNFDAEDLDTDGMFTATSRVITIQTTGIYSVHGMVSVVANATGNRLAAVYKNPTFSGSGDTSTISGGTIIAESAHTQAGSTEASSAASTIFEFTAGDTIGLGFFQNSGVSLANANTYVTSLSAFWIGRSS